MQHLTYHLLAPHPPPSLFILLLRKCLSLTLTLFCSLVHATSSSSPTNWSSSSAPTTTQVSYNFLLERGGKFPPWYFYRTAIFLFFLFSLYKEVMLGDLEALFFSFSLLALFSCGRQCNTNQDTKPVLLYKYCLKCLIVLVFNIYWQKCHADPPTTHISKHCKLYHSSTYVTFICLYISQSDLWMIQ